MTEGQKLPQSWVIVRVADIGETVTGNTPPKSDVRNYGSYIPFVKPPELINGVINSADDNLSEVGSKKSRVLPPNSVLVSCIGNLGRTGINKTQIAFNQQINAIIPYEGIEPKFVFYQAQSIFFRNQLENLASATTIAIVNKGNFQKISLYLAPHKEQKRIIAKIEELFSKLDKGIENLKIAREQLKVYRQAVLKSAFEGKFTTEWRDIHSIDATDSQVIRVERKNAPDMPDELTQLCADTWPWTRLGSISKVSGGLTKNPKRQKLPLKMKYLRVANVYADKIFLDDVLEIGVTGEEFDAVRLVPGDLLVVEGNGSVGQIGRVAVWDGQLSDVGHQNHLIKVRLVEGMNPRFFLYFLMSPLGRELIVKKASSTSGLHTLSISKVSSLPVPVPSTGEQSEIVRLFEAQMSIIENLEATIEAELQKSEALRQSILKKAFSGKLVAQDPNDEPASVLLERIRAEKNAQNTEGKKTKAKRSAA